MIHPLKAFRERQSPRLTQAQLAELIGVAEPTVCRYERGERLPAPDIVRSISEKTGIPVADLRPDLADLVKPRARRQRAP